MLFFDADLISWSSRGCSSLRKSSRTLSSLHCNNCSAALSALKASCMLLLPPCGRNVPSTGWLCENGKMTISELCLFFVFCSEQRGRVLPVSWILPARSRPGERECFSSVTPELWYWSDFLFSFLSSSQTWSMWTWPQSVRYVWIITFLFFLVVPAAVPSNNTNAVCTLHPHCSLALSLCLCVCLSLEFHLLFVWNWSPYFSFQYATLKN